jgi:hypothetical protein
VRRNRLLVLFVVVLASCGGAATSTTLASTTSTSSTTTTVQVTTTTLPPATTTIKPTTTTTGPGDGAEGSGCTPGDGPLPDGEWFGLVTSRSEAQLEFDLACWFTGDADIEASAEDGEESPPPNDYYVRNTNPATRAVPIGELVEVTFYPGGDPNDVSEIDYDDWAGMVATRGYELGVWLKVEDGAITEIIEQWVP